MKKNLIALIIILIQLLAFSPIYSQVTAEEKEVWQLEKKYYQYAKANDPERYLSLFHEDVIGWPTIDTQPKGKEKVSLWISSVHENPREEWNYELKLLAIKSFDNVVIVHYLLRDIFVSSESVKEIKSFNYRISHTWLYENDKWQIISGMGGNLN